MMTPITSPSPGTSDTQASSSATPATSSYSGRKKAKKVVPQSSSVASVLETYLSKKEEVSVQEDPLTDFFLNMAKTVKTFPKRDQLLIKNELFWIVNKVELRLLGETTTEPNISIFQNQQDYVLPPSCPALTWKKRDRTRFLTHS